MANQPPDMEDIVKMYRGLAILQTLHREVSQSSNEEVMRAWLDELKMGGTREQIRMELERLASLGLIQTELRGHKGNTMVFWLREAGLDYLESRSAIEGLPKIGPDTSIF